MEVNVDRPDSAICSNNAAGPDSPVGANGADRPDVARAWRLVRQGRAEPALAVLAGLTPCGADLAEALTVRLAALLALRRVDEYASALDSAFETTHDRTAPGHLGLLHAYAALAAHHQGSLDRCVSHLVVSDQTLSTIELTDADTVRAWHGLAVAYSQAGFHAHAATAIERARRIASAIGAASPDLAAPTLRLRRAVWLDQRGDTEAGTRILRDVAHDLATRRLANGIDTIRPVNQRAYGYAIARLAALGHHDVFDATRPGTAAPRTTTPRASGGFDIHAMLATADDSVTADHLGVLGAACLAIADHRPVEAAARLETACVSDETFGQAEVERLRALAHLAAGDFASAYQADRRAFRESDSGFERLRGLVLDGAAARLDHENVRRAAARHTTEELTDPLTGLPNRRHLEQYVGQTLVSGRQTVLGLCEVATLGDITAAHGRHCGDMVLHRVAGVLHRVVRRGDFVARYQDDQFAVALPSATSAAEASEIARRIAAAVATEDWTTVVPGVPVRLTISWTGVRGEDAPGCAYDAFTTADRALARAKAAAPGGGGPVTAADAGR